MTDEEEFLIQMKNFFEGIDKLKKNLEEDIHEKEQMRNDLLHELELGNLNAIEMTQVAKTLKEVLQARRISKDELNKVMTLKGFADKYNNKLITGDIIQVLKNLRTLKNNQENRKYRARKLTNLKCAGGQDEQNRNTNEAT